MVESVDAWTHDGVGAQTFRLLYETVNDDEGNYGRYFSLRREPALLSDQARHHGARTSYRGTEVYLSLVDQHALLYADDAAPLASVGLMQAPRAPFGEHETAWRLIRLMNLNVVPFEDMDHRQGGLGLRDLLRLFTDGGDAVQLRQIQSLVGMKTRVTSHKLDHRGPLAFARGIDCTLTVDEQGFSGLSPYLFGLVLEQYLMRHAAINTYTRTELNSMQRGPIARWPMRIVRHPGRPPMKRDETGAHGVSRLLFEMTESLVRESWRHGFLALLRRLGARPDIDPVGTAQRPSDEPFRLGQKPSLAFAPSEIVSVEVDRVRLFVRLFGLGMLGPNGARPIHVTEVAKEHEESRADGTLVDFLDVFHHRYLTLFYRAWAGAQAAASLDCAGADRERFSFYVRSLAGLGHADSRSARAACACASRRVGASGARGAQSLPMACARPDHHALLRRACVDREIRVPLDRRRG